MRTPGTVSMPDGGITISSHAVASMYPAPVVSCTMAYTFLPALRARATAARNSSTLPRPIAGPLMRRMMP